MFEHIQQIQGNVLALKISGEITDREHDRLDSLIRESIDKWGALRILVVVKHYASLSSAEALFEDLRMVKRHADHIDRMAVVGDRIWKRTWVGLFGLFSRIETDYYELEQMDAAWQWITEGIENFKTG